MTKKTLKELVTVSFKKNTLDEKTVLTIAEKLTRHQLKKYIHELKSEVRKNTVTVVSSKPLSQTAKRLFESEYPKKELEFAVKPDILLGLQIINNDVVYDSSLKHTFDEITQFVSE